MILVLQLFQDCIDLVNHSIYIKQQSQLTSWLCCFIKKIDENLLNLNLAFDSLQRHVFATICYSKNRIFTFCKVFR